MCSGSASSVRIPSIVNRTILLDNEPHTVVGVLPAGSAFDRAVQSALAAARVRAVEHDARLSLAGVVRAIETGRHACSRRRPT